MFDLLVPAVGFVLLAHPTPLLGLAFWILVLVAASSTLSTDTNQIW